jgi:threonine/homoserine/homoserine lactone efflux protein
MDTLALGAFVISATALLGSPGPGITALVAVGRTHGLVHGLRYYAGLQVGLALAAGATAVGLVWVLIAVPALLAGLMLLATAYLLYLAYRVATAPVGSALRDATVSMSPWAGLFLGLVNPKAMLAFASLFATRAILPDRAQGDVLLKWGLCVVVMLVVDLAWLLFGVALNRASLPPATERSLNLCFAAAIVMAAALSFV